jgi:hypothetical protein
MAIKWEYIQPPGIIQMVEVQYTDAKNYTKIKDLEMEEEKLEYKKSMSSLESFGTKSQQFELLLWNVLVRKTWNYDNFNKFCFEKLTSESKYCYRVRYHNHKGWSNFSKISEIMSTKPAVPSPPSSLICAAAMCDSAQIFWTRAKHENGAPVLEYELRGRSGIEI